MTGAFARRRMFAASWSGGVRPVDGIDHEDDDVGLGDRQPGLLLDARLDGIVGSSSRPPVSTSTNRRPFHSPSP